MGRRTNNGRVRLPDVVVVKHVRNDGNRGNLQVKIQPEEGVSRLAAEGPSSQGQAGRAKRATRDRRGKYYGVPASGPTNWS